MEKYDQIYARAIRLLAALLGFGIAIWEVLADKVAHPWAFAAAITFIGLPAARAAEDVIRLLANSSNTESRSSELEVVEHHPPSPDHKPQRKR